MAATTEPSPLYAAVLDGDAAAVATLLADGADPDPVDQPAGARPLMSAVDDDASLEITRLLVEAGADVNITCAESGQTPLLVAIAQGAP